MTRRAPLLVLALLLSVLPVRPAGAGEVTMGNAGQLEVYEVNRGIPEFPDGEDLSTPEAAYATFRRISASGDQAPWRRLSVPRIARRMPRRAEKREVSAEAKRMFLSAEILEVRIFRNKYCAVLAEIPRPAKNYIDIRFLELTDGRWLNVGNTVKQSLSEARVAFGRYCSRQVELPSRPKVDGPEAY